MPCLCITVAGLLASAIPASSAEPPPAQFSHSLFDGQSLHGWTAENGCEAAVENGLLVLKGGDGWLRSEHTYADFVLRVEWRAPKATNYDTGIFVRTPPKAKTISTPGYQ